MRTIDSPLDLTKARTVVYHLPDGDKLSLEVDALLQFMELGLGRICDTSEINGVIHFFPKGNA